MLDLQHRLGSSSTVLLDSIVSFVAILINPLKMFRFSCCLRINLTLLNRKVINSLVCFPFGTPVKSLDLKLHFRSSLFQSRRFCQLSLSATRVSATREVLDSEISKHRRLDLCRIPKGDFPKSEMESSFNNSPCPESHHRPVLSHSLLSLFSTKLSIPSFHTYRIRELTLDEVRVFSEEN